MKCDNCKKEISETDKRWITDVCGTFFDEICPYCRADIKE